LTADELASRAQALVQHWRTQPVNRKAWYKAEEYIAQMFLRDEERATAASEKVAQWYEVWLAEQGSAHQKAA
jgi:hypothetical protein